MSELLPPMEWADLLQALRGGVGAGLVKFRRRHKGYIEPAILLAGLRAVTRELAREARDGELMRGIRA